MRAAATGRILHSPRGGSFRFDAGAVCLDFAHTGGEGEYAIYESLHEPADLGDWLASPPLSAVMTVPVTTRDLVAAKALRQAIWDAAHARAAGRCLPAEAIAVINRAAAVPSLVPSLLPSPLTGVTGVGAAPSPGPGVAAAWALPVRAAQALSTLAREMIGLLSGPLADRIRECAGDNCPLVFVDSSRPGARRWCTMERCGNRHKVRALRTRRATDP